MITRRYIIQGRVQGVGFRYFARKMAEAFDVSGTVRNVPDGSVEIVASATEANHRSFREQIGIGPSGARVDRMNVQDLDPVRFDGFGVIG